jgi:hypothetical protein
VSRLYCKTQVRPPRIRHALPQSIYRRSGSWTAIVELVVGCRLRVQGTGRMPCCVTTSEGIEIQTLVPVLDSETVVYKE